MFSLQLANSLTEAHMILTQGNENQYFVGLFYFEPSSIIILYSADACYCTYAYAVSISRFVNHERKISHV